MTGRRVQVKQGTTHRTAIRISRNESLPEGLVSIVRSGAKGRQRHSSIRPIDTVWNRLAIGPKDAG